MTGFESKRRAAQDKLDDDDDTQVYADTLTIVYQRGFADGKKAAQRPWVGLTEEEVAIASAEFDTRLKLAFHSGMYKAQIILRKKNDSTY